MSAQNKLQRREMHAIIMLVMGLVALLVAWGVYTAPRARGAPAAGPDLTVEISLSPTVPELNQPVTINVVARNIGSSDASSQVQVLLYVDPPDRPPIPSTTGFPLISVPGLAAGGFTSGTRQHTFTTGGCDHVIYAWIDRDDTIGESNEANNLVALPVCVGVACAADSYEPDNLCSAPGSIVENVAQVRSFCDPTDPSLPDEDWVKFTAFAGVTYTLATANVGVHAAPVIELRNACGGPVQANDPNQVTWQAPATGVYFAHLTSAGGVQGPLTAYNLTLSSSTGVTDNYEPDNSCAMARDIATGGTRQTHLFQTPGDEDWVKYPVDAGDSFFIVADNTTPGVSPVVTVFASCDQVPANNSLGPSGAQVSQNSPTAAVYYVRICNQNPGTFGANARYDLSVTVSACSSDGEEEDDSAAQARTVAVGAVAKSHNFCPSSDEDWIKFDLQANKTYVLLTSNLAFASDTVLTLYAADGTTQIAENDDYGYVSGSRIIYRPTSAGTYLARVRHANPAANGPNTNYDLSVQEGVCSPDPQDSAGGDNGPGDATLLATSGISQTRDFCADPLNAALGDQDWVTFNALSGGTYQLHTAGLGPNTDTVLDLYAGDGSTQLLHNDDIGHGRGAALSFTASDTGPYYPRA